MWVYYTKHIYLREKKGAREKNKADLFETTVHYWGEDENIMAAMYQQLGGSWFFWCTPYQTCTQQSHSGPSVLASLAVKSKGYLATPWIPNQVINLILLYVTLPQ